MSTLVVVPSLLTDPERVADLLLGLEIRYLANRDKNLYFGLLIDLADAEQEIMPEDEHLLLLAHNGIEALNEKYPGGMSSFSSPAGANGTPRMRSGEVMSEKGA